MSKLRSKVMSSGLALALCASTIFAMTAGATSTDSTASASTEEVVKPSTIEQQRIDDMLKKYGLDKLDLSFAKEDFYGVFLEEDKAQIEADAKRTSMRGILDGTTMYTAQVDRKVAGAEHPYQLKVVVFADLRTGLVNAAEMIAYPYPTYTEGAKIYAVDSKLEDVDKAMATFMARAYQPKNEAHRAAAIPGYPVSSTKGAAIRNYFKGEGWNLGNYTVYQNPGAWVSGTANASGYTPYLNDAEVGQAMTASANGGPAVLMMMSGSGFYFVEKPYKFKGTDEYFYVAFCAFGGDANKAEYMPTFSWLMVRPAKYNMDGTFDKFFYPVETKLQDIVNDMSAYYENSKVPTPEGAVN